MASTRLYILQTPTFRVSFETPAVPPVLYNPDTVDILIERFTLKGARTSSKQLAQWPSGGDIVNSATGLFDYAADELTVEEEIVLTWLGIGGSIGAKKRAPGIQRFRVYPIPLAIL